MTPEQQKSLKTAWEACVDDHSVEWNVSNASEHKSVTTLRDGRKQWTYSDGDTHYRRTW